MFVALGAGIYSAGIFHLFTHAFFKALLFLGAGSVIHAMHHEQDMRHMGGLRKHIPLTAAAMTIGTLALTGFPGFAGYFSKDAVIESAYASVAHGGLASSYAFVLLVVAAGMTSFYSWRLYFMTFEGAPRWGHGHDAHAHDHDDHAHAADGHDDHGHGHDHTPHESPWTMLVPLAVLSLGAIVAGYAFKEAFIGHDFEHFWKSALFMGKDNHILHAMHEVPKWVVWSPFVAMVIGFALAWYMYVRRPEIPGKLAAANPALYQFLLNKWYFDELYDFLFVRPAKWLGRFLWKKGDGLVIDGFGPDGVSARVVDVTNRVVRLQTGYLYHYAFAMLIGVAGLVTWYLVARG
jgi:NADH-quinone oxidoreductase subunit L